jgi:hypothetical protein
VFLSKLSIISRYLFICLNLSAILGITVPFSSVTPKSDKYLPNSALFFFGISCDSGGFLSKLGGKLTVVAFPFFEN